MGFNPFETLGINSNASSKEIKNAFKERSLECHPDRGGDEQKMAEINKAYALLTDEQARQRWEASADGESSFQVAGALPSAGERPSESYRRFFSALVERFGEAPLKLVKLEKRQNTFRGLSELSSEWLKEEHYQHLYKAREAAVELTNIFELIDYNEKWSTPAKPLKPSFFQETLTPGKATTILLGFLRGEYYGENLEHLKNYLVAQIAPLYQINNPDVSFYRAILTILTTKNLEREYPNLLEAFELIYASVYQRKSADNPHVIGLMQDKHYRHLLLQTLTHYWQSGVVLVHEENQQAMRTQYISPEKLAPYGRVLFRLETQMQAAFSETASLENLYETAFIMIDMMHAALTTSSAINSLFNAALCFQIAAKREAEPARAMAAERLALSIYQAVLQRAFNATSVMTLYVTTHVAKLLTELSYDQTTLTQEELLRRLSQPGDAAIVSHSGSVEATIEGAIKRAIYLLDFCPIFSKPKSTLDLGVIQLYQVGLLRYSLDKLLANRPLTNHRLATVLYHAYEETIDQMGSEALAQNQKKNQLKLEAMEALLDETGGGYFDMARMIDEPYIHMRKDVNGFFDPIDELDFPEEAGIAVYQAFHGYEYNSETGELKFLLQEWKPGEARLRRLFTEYDVFQMIEQGIEGGFFSLDHADANKRYHPLQSVRFAPAALEGTEFLQTLFMTDYLLKMFTTGTEISSQPPYLTRSTQALIERLPEHLKQVLNACCKEGKSIKNQAHRFWITAGDIETEEQKEGVWTKVYFGNIAMRVQKHLLKFDEHANLVDSEMNQDDNSDEAQFAKGMTEFYDEIGAYFPEFLRLKELVKIAGAVAKLKKIYQVNQLQLEANTKLLADKSIWDDMYQKAFADKQSVLQKAYNNLPAPIQACHPLTDNTWWNAHTEELARKKLAAIQSVFNSFPKFAYQLHDAEVVQDYNRIYTENYNRISQKMYEELYQLNKNSIIAKHGQAAWDREEARIAGELRTAANQQATTVLAQGLTQQSILNQYNTQAAEVRARIRQRHYDMFPDIKKRLGEAAYAAAIDAFMNGSCQALARAIAIDEVEDKKTLYQNIRQGFYNQVSELQAQLGETAFGQAIDGLMSGHVNPLAEAMARQAVEVNQGHVKVVIAKKQRIVDQFSAMRLNGNPPSKEKANTSLRVPAVFQVNQKQNSSRRVYGGVKAYPSYFEVQNLTSRLTSSFSSTTDIHSAERVLFEMRGRNRLGLDSNIMRLESAVAAARMRLFRLDFDRVGFNLPFQSTPVSFDYQTTLQQQIVQDALQSAPDKKTNPFIPFRLAASLERTAAATNQLISESINSRAVVPYRRNPEPPASSESSLTTTVSEYVSAAATGLLNAVKHTTQAAVDSVKLVGAATITTSPVLSAVTKRLAPEMHRQAVAHVDRGIKAARATAQLISDAYVTTLPGVLPVLMMTNPAEAQRAIDAVSGPYRALVQASGPKRVEMLTEIIGSMLIPMGLVSGTKNLVNLYKHVGGASTQRFHFAVTADEGLLVSPVRVSKPIPEAVGPRVRTRTELNQLVNPSLVGEIELYELSSGETGYRVKFQSQTPLSLKPLESGAGSASVANQGIFGTPSVVSAPSRAQAQQVTPRVTEVEVDAGVVRERPEPTRVSDARTSGALIETTNTPKTYPLFQVNSSGMAESRIPIHFFNLQEISTFPGRGEFIYVITEDNELKIGLRTFHTHDELASGKRVFSAGELDVQNGLIIKINEESGHYCPYGSHLADFTETRFVEEGFSDAPGKFHYEPRRVTMSNAKLAIVSGSAAPRPVSKVTTQTSSTSTNAAHFFSSEDVKTFTSETAVRYAIRENGKIIFASLDIPFSMAEAKGFLHTKPRLPDRAPIVSAGIVRVKNGQIIDIQVEAEKFNPSGLLTQLSFEQQGFHYSVNSEKELLHKLNEKKNPLSSEKQRFFAMNESRSGGSGAAPVSDVFLQKLKAADSLDKHRVEARYQAYEHAEMTETMRVNRASLLHFYGCYREALVDVRTVLKTNPTHVEALIQMALLYRALEEHSIAWGLYKTAERVNAPGKMREIRSYLGPLEEQFPDFKTNNPDILFEKAMHYADSVEDVEMELNAERAVVSAEP